MKYLTALLLLAGLIAPALAAIPPAQPMLNMRVEEMPKSSSNNTAIVRLADDDGALYGRAFPRVEAGTIKAVRIRVSSLQSPVGGGATLNMLTPTVTSGGNAFYMVSSMFSNTVNVGSHTEFRIRFAPQSVGMFTAQVTLQYEHDPFNQPGVYSDFRINLSGEGSATQMSQVHVYEDFPMNSTDVYHMAPVVGGRQFGNRKVGAGPSDPISISVLNGGETGAADLNTSMPRWVSGGANFRIDASGYSTTHTPSHGSGFYVTFEPGTVGHHTAILEFDQDDGHQADPFRIVFEGTGVADADQLRVGDQPGFYFDHSFIVPSYIGTHINEYAVATGPRDFGNVDGSQPMQTLTITVANADVGYMDWFGYVPGADLTLGTPVVVGDQDFSLDLSSFNTTLTSATTTTFTIRFRPWANGVRTAIIELPHGDDSERAPFRIVVTGTGVNVSSSAGGGGSGGGGGGCAANESSSSMLALLGLLGALALATRLRRLV